jgi:hypothetical protein
MKEDFRRKIADECTRLNKKYGSPEYGFVFIQYNEHGIDFTWLTTNHGGWARIWITKWIDGCQCQIGRMSYQYNNGKPKLYSVKMYKTHRDDEIAKKLETEDCSGKRDLNKIPSDFREVLV